MCVCVTTVCAGRRTRCPQHTDALEADTHIAPCAQAKTESQGSRGPLERVPWADAGVWGSALLGCATHSTGCVCVCICVVCVRLTKQTCVSPPHSTHTMHTPQPQQNARNNSKPVLSKRQQWFKAQEAVLHTTFTHTDPLPTLTARPNARVRRQQMRLRCVYVNELVSFACKHAHIYSSTNNHFLSLSHTHTHTHPQGER
jgi:hypothetical protein